MFPRTTREVSDFQQILTKELFHQEQDYLYLIAIESYRDFF